MINIVIGEDDTLIRESLNIILSANEEVNVVGAYENGQLALKRCLEGNIDIALLDIRMPIMNGVEATKEISSRTNTKVIILTTFDEEEYIKEAIGYGAKGYLLKNNKPEDIINTIKMVYIGNCVIQDRVLEKYQDNGQINIGQNKLKGFTEREIEIIEAIAEGLNNKEIAAKLFISEGTVKNYISSIISKAGLQHRTQIAINYLKGGL